MIIDYQEKLIRIIFQQFEFTWESLHLDNAKNIFTNTGLPVNWHRKEIAGRGFTRGRSAPCFTKQYSMFAMKTGAKMSRIQNYTEFKSRLDNSVTSLRQLMLVYPTELSLNAICNQLEALDEWSSDGHSPTLEQKGQLNFGLLAGYNLAPIDPDLTNELHALNYFLLYWND